MSSEYEARKKNEELEDAAACGKLWEIYAKEAQEYDDRLVKSWKEDMDSILVFSGLYSAILTAFIIESYQNLQPDPADNSVVLLKRISQQLATPSNSSSLTPFPDDEAFSPASSALACNILWFISLALALTCAFLATLVQQWSRRFLHRTSAARSPGFHAHLLQYLYFGLKDLKMHAIVDLIPSLLHVSLFGFFAGLIGFLYDVNNVLTWLFAIALGIVLLTYFTFTLLPLVYLSSPYSTPLSPILWQMWQFIKGKVHSLLVRLIQDYLSRMKPGNQQHNSPDEVVPRVPDDEEAQPLPSKKTTPLNMNDPQRGYLSLIDASLVESQKRCNTHESLSIPWTLSSLNDDGELLPFLEALPRVLLGDDLDHVREGNFHLMDALASGDPRTGIVTRTLSLMENAKYSWHDENHRKRCATAGAKTLYSLARVLVDQKFRGRLTESDKWPSPFTGQLARIAQEELFRTEESKSFYNSVVALCILSVFQPLHDCIQSDALTLHSQSEEARILLEEHSLTEHRDFIKIIRSSGNKSSAEHAKSTIKELISTAFYGYLLHTIDRPSFNLVHVSKQMMPYGSDFLQAEEDPGDLFNYLCHSYSSQRPTESADIERMDTIFRIGSDGFMSFTSQRSETDQCRAARWMLNYIGSRFHASGWGSTRELWSPEQVLKVLNCLRQSEASLNNVSESACKNYCFTQFMKMTMLLFHSWNTDCLIYMHNLRRKTCLNHIFGFSLSSSFCTNFAGAPIRKEFLPYLIRSTANFL